MARDAEMRTMAAIALGVGGAAALSPRLLLRLFGIPSREVTGAAAFGWRLFAARNVYIGARALRGDPTARDAFLPVQALDQLVFWHAYRTRSVPRPASLLAAATSAVIVALDLRRRRG